MEPAETLALVEGSKTNVYMANVTKKIFFANIIVIYVDSKSLVAALCSSNARGFGN